MLANGMMRIGQIVFFGLICLIGGICVPAILLLGFVLVSDGLYLLTSLTALAGVALFFVLEWSWDGLLRALALDLGERQIARASPRDDQMTP
jgi:hypothetical protein